MLNSKFCMFLINVLKLLSLLDGLGNNASVLFQWSKVQVTGQILVRLGSSLVFVFSQLTLSFKKVTSTHGHNKILAPIEGCDDKDP